MNHLLDRWEEIVPILKNKKILLLLDFDGTLCPIVSTPDLAQLPSSTKNLLQQLSQQPFIQLGFVSGREIENLKLKIGIENAFYSGSHGMTLQGFGVHFEQPVPLKDIEKIQTIDQQLQVLVQKYKGVLIENKETFLTVHYRLLNPEEMEPFKAEFLQCIESDLNQKSILLKEGKMLFEIFPPSLYQVNKGTIVNWLLTHLKNSHLFPIFVGDDLTDEDAFLAVAPIGIGILVGARSTHAKYCLADPQEVTVFLEKILDLFKI